MKKILAILAAVSMAVLISVSSASAWTVSIEQIGEVEAVDGSTFTAEIYFNADEGGNFLEYYSFNLAYDTDELTYSSYTQETLSGLTNGLLGDVIIEDGLLSSFNAGNFSGGYTATDDVLLATVTFTVSDPVWDDDLDVWFYEYAGYEVLFTVDGTNYNIEGTSYAVEGPDVGAVPIPSAVLLLGSGLLGLVGIRRRR